jgi:hypothetical protein
MGLAHRHATTSCGDATKILNLSEDLVPTLDAAADHSFCGDRCSKPNTSCAEESHASSAG